MRNTQEQNFLLDEMAEDAKLSHVVDSVVINGTYYILGFKGARWAFVYGAEDGDWGCCFQSFGEVGEPYQPWFEDAVLRHRRAALPEAYDHGDVPIRFAFVEEHKGCPQERVGDVPASVVHALGYRRAFEGWMKIPANSIDRWDEAAMPADVSAILPGI
ncbi:hypothetical protein F6X40_24020 [Paraburkholderia sp. UCT31]|uniref:hypothetical protein n=1 Tax=Paraburkholderia sp. UCT31 TaxID=2615209 RepID=UPI001655652D|nr:hypothetical protein [Paraburkholderia sp. UCT31]MBC8739784.1 hypothetical protein [Paraburkholderia sp. UCT31]